MSGNEKKRQNTSMPKSFKFSDNSSFVNWTLNVSGTSVFMSKASKSALLRLGISGAHDRNDNCTHCTVAHMFSKCNTHFGRNALHI